MVENVVPTQFPGTEFCAGERIALPDESTHGKSVIFVGDDVGLAVEKDFREYAVLARCETKPVLGGNVTEAGGMLILVEFLVLVEFLYVDEGKGRFCLFGSRVLPGWGGGLPLTLRSFLSCVIGATNQPTQYDER